MPLDKTFVNDKWPSFIFGIKHDQMKFKEKINRQMITDIVMILLLAMAIVILIIIL